MAMAARLNLRMQKELNLLASDPPPGVSLPFLSDPSSDSSPSLSSIDACIRGPQGTVYEHGVFCVKIQIPERYPFQPPIVTFSTPIYHPNIDNGGRICLDILNLPPKGAWVPSLNISTVLTSIGLLLSEPNPDDGLMCEASREYKYNRQAFDEKARAWTARFANPGSSGVNSSSCFLPNVHTDNFIDADSGAINVVSECESAPKALPGRRKLSLASKTMMVGNNNDNQENVDPVVDLVTCSSKQSKPTGMGTSKLSFSEFHKDNQANVDPVVELLSYSSKQSKPTAMGTSKLSLSQFHNDNQTNVDPVVVLLSYSSKQSKPTGFGTSKLSLSQSHNDNQENVDPIVELLSCSSKSSKPTCSGTFKLSVSQSHKSVEQQNQQSPDEKASRDCCHLEEERNEIASIIVSDSEESEDESKEYSKLKLPLRRKRCAR